MATKTINNFGVITTMASTDKVPLWQVSSAATKAITYSDLTTNILATLGSTYVEADGTVVLTADWDIGTGRKILADQIKARSASGLALYDTTAGTGVLVADGGLVIVNGVSSLTGLLGTAQLQINKTSNGSMLLHRESADSGGVTFEFLKRRSGWGVVSSGDRIGTFFFSCADSVDAAAAAAIYAEVDGTPGSNDMPGRLILATTADGASTSAEALRIDSAQNVGIGGTATTGFRLEVIGNPMRVAYDTDKTSYLGRTAIGYGSGNSDWAFVSHVDMTASGNGGFFQSNTGASWLNSAAAQNINFSIAGVQKVIIEAAGHMWPNTDNALTCGKSGQRWSAIWAANGTIQTSDEREKRSVMPSPLGLEFIRKLEPISWIWADDERPEKREKRVIRQAKTKLRTKIETVIEEIAGKLTRVERAIEVAEPVVKRRPVYDAQGAQVYEEVGGQQVAVLVDVPIYEEIEEDVLVQPAVSIQHSRPHYGFSAQKVKNTLDELGIDWGGYVYDAETDSHALRYHEFMAPMVAAIQVLDDRLDRLEKARVKL